MPVGVASVLSLGGLAGGLAWAAGPDSQRLVQEPHAVYREFAPEPGAEIRLVEGRNSIMKVTLPKAWSKNDRLQVVLATLVIENRGGFLPSVSCTAAQGSAFFSIPSAVEGRPYSYLASFQSGAGETRTVALVCDLIDPPSPPDARVMRAALTVIPQNLEGLAKRGLCRRSALERHAAVSSVAPIVEVTIGAPCVLASRRPSHSVDEQRSAKPS